MFKLPVSLSALIIPIVLSCSKDKLKEDIDYPQTTNTITLPSNDTTKS